MQANLRPKHEWEGGAAAPFLLQNAKNLRRIPAAVPSATSNNGNQDELGQNKMKQFLTYTSLRKSLILDKRLPYQDNKDNKLSLHCFIDCFLT